MISTPLFHPTAVETFSKIYPACETLWGSFEEQEGNPWSAQPLTWVPRDLPSLAVACWVSRNFWRLPSNVWIFVALGAKRKVDVYVPWSRPRERLWFRNTNFMRSDSTTAVPPPIISMRICHGLFSGNVESREWIMMVSSHMSKKNKPIATMRAREPFDQIADWFKRFPVFAF